MNKFDIIGKSESEAIGMLETAGIKWRIAGRDGKPYRVTADFVKGRYNLMIDKGEVVSVRIE
jgi:hypothetical protein